MPWWPNVTPNGKPQLAPQWFSKIICEIKFKFIASSTLKENNVSKPAQTYDAIQRGVWSKVLNPQWTCVEIMALVFSQWEEAYAQQ